MGPLFVVVGATVPPNSVPDPRPPVAISSGDEVLKSTKAGIPSPNEETTYHKFFISYELAGSVLDTVVATYNELPNIESIPNNTTTTPLPTASHGPDGEDRADVGKIGIDPVPARVR